MKNTRMMTAILVGALSLGSALAQNQTIKLATITPLSGSSSDLGTQIKSGAQLALNEFKPQFAKLGINLQLVGYDDQADPATGTAAARRVAADKSILAVVGTLNSGVAIPASEVLAPSHVAMVSPANTNVKVTDRGLANMNRICARDDAQGPAGAQYLVEGLKAKKVYVLNDKTPYGQGLADQAQKYLESKGVQVVGAEGVDPNEKDFSAIISKVQLLRPDAIYFGGLYGQAGPFAKQLRDKSVSTPLMGGDGYDSDDLIKLAGTGANNIYFTTVAAPLDALPAAKTFASSFQKTFGKEAQGFGVFGYDAAKVALTGVLNAVKANKNKVPTREQVEKAIRGVNVASGLLSGPVKFNSVGDRTSAKMYVIQVSNGARKTASSLTVKAPRQ